MTRKGAGALSPVGVLAVLAAVVALTAQAGTAARGSASPTTLLHAAEGAQVHGAVSFAATPPDGEGTSVALTIHGLPAHARVDARLHAGHTLDRLSASSTPLPGGSASAIGSFRAHGRVLFRGGNDVRVSDITDGGHTVVVHAGGRLVAYAVVPRT